MNSLLAEFIGTLLLVAFGNGVVANVLLARTKGFNGGWIVITAGWGLAVFVGVFCAQEFSGAHLNPAITVAMALAEKFAWVEVPGYLLAQLLGGVVGGMLVYGFYREHFKASDDPNAKLACFCTAPNIRNLPQAFFCELVGTFMLVFPVFLMVGAKAKLPSTPDEVLIGLGTLGAVPVALLVFAIGLSLGGTTGYAINPARDLGPRLAHAILPVPGKRGSDWGYAWVPVIAPLAGGVLAALAYRLVIPAV
ncbi:MAG TPA: MIP/aquaporin family protein [Verrucomicrobiota bacterium]|nr:MIP/aquaporin family protein [Verrucomicrobiota bacterium]HNT14300.1 MIP/aquaporin family protein [Verrucomicrobiota bacterium]